MQLDGAEVSALERATDETVTLIGSAARSLTIDQAADRLGVHRSRISHRLRDGKLYFFRIGAPRRLPVWQFTPDPCSLPGLEQVLAALPNDLHPTAVEGFFSTPNPDLDGRTPADWLAGGGDPQHVVDEALSRPVVKLPQVPPGPLTRRPGDLHLVRRNVALWRVHLGAGPQVTPWDQLRFVGPTASRFDPQAPPTHVSSRGVTYAGLDVPTVLAEVFQLTRVIDTHRRATYLTSWHPTLTLFTAAADAFPARPSFSRQLRTPALNGSLRAAGAGIGYRPV